MEGFNDFQEIAGHTFRLGEMENAVLLICVFICFYTHAYQKIRKFWAFNGSQPIFFVGGLVGESLRTPSKHVTWKNAIDDISQTSPNPINPILS